MIMVESVRAVGARTCSGSALSASATKRRRRLGRLDEAEADARDLGPGVYAGPLAAVQAAEAYSEKLLVLTDSAVLRASKAAGDGAEDLEDVQVTVFEWKPKDRLQVDPG